MIAVCCVRHVILSQFKLKVCEAMSNITIVYSRIQANPCTIEVSAAFREQPPNTDNAAIANRAVVRRFT